MNALAPLVNEAREHLLARAKREGLVTVGYDVMDSPLGPLWIAVGPRGVVNIHYGATPDARELARITHAYGPGVLPDRRACDRVLTELDQHRAGARSVRRADHLQGRRASGWERAGLSRGRSGARCKPDPDRGSLPSHRGDGRHPGWLRGWLGREAPLARSGAWQDGGSAWGMAAVAALAF